MFKQRFLVAPVILILLLSLCAILTNPVPVKAQTSNPPHSEYAPNQIIVRFRAGASEDQKTAIKSDLNAVVLKELKIINAQLWRISGTDVNTAVTRYSSNPAVVYIEPNYRLTADVFPNDPQFPQLWGMHNTGAGSCLQDADIDAPEAWDIVTGGNVVIGVIDTGIDWLHPDLAGNVWMNPGEIPGNLRDDDGNGYVDDIYGWDFVNGDNSPWDDNGHGTHVSGTIAAVGQNGIGVVGVCWTAKIMALKFLDASGSGYTSDAILAIEYAVMMGARVTNNSWGGGSFSQALMDAIEASGNAGMLFVAAAGNDGLNNDLYPHYPSSYPLDCIISVAATDCQDHLASFSNYGLTSVDLGAPGVNILSCFLDDGYVWLDGTSMATPHVAGAVALVWSEFPSLSNANVKDRILTLVDPLSALAGKCTTGGRLNLFRSVMPTDSIPPGNVTDLAVIQSMSNSVTLSWTAVGDDGYLGGPASWYDVRYASWPITEANFALASQATGEPSPQPAGQTEVFTVNGLLCSSTYYFALKVYDEWGNSSAVSNCAVGSTPGCPDISLNPDFLADTLFVGGSSVNELVIRNDGEGTLEFQFPDFVAHALLNTPGVQRNDVTNDYRHLDLKKGEPDPRVGKPVVLGAGGPDSFGYSWIDSDEPGGPIFSWVEISGIGTPLNLGCDDCYAEIALPIEFSFYGQPKTSVKISSNGYLTFGTSGSDYSNDPIPSPYEPNDFIAPFWTDLALYNQGNVYYYHDHSSNSFIVEYLNVPHLGGGGPYTFEVILYPNGNISLQYLDVNPPTNSSTIGIENSDGSDGLQIAFNTEYVHDGLAVRISTTPKWITAVQPAYGTVWAGDSVIVGVTFDASGLAAGYYENSIEVRSNDPDENSLPVNCGLEVIGAGDIDTSPDSLDFGLVFIGYPDTLSLLVSNVGTESLTVSPIACIDNPSYDVYPTNFVLPPRGTQSVRVIFSPAALGASPGTLAIDSDDPDEPTVYVWLLGTGGACPDIIVFPSAISDSLFTGQTSSHTLIIANSGGSTLNFEVSLANLAGPAALQAMNSARAVDAPSFLNRQGSSGGQGARESSRTLPLDQRASSSPYSGGKTPLRGPLAVVPSVSSAVPSSGGMNLVIVHSSGDPSEIRGQLLAFPDVATVGLFDARYSTPTLEVLLQYDAAIVVNDYAFGDPSGLGNVLADYVDAGGGLLLTVASFASGWEVGGRLLTDGYLPFNVGVGPVGSSTLGSFDPTHPIMQGVTNAYGDLLIDCTLSSGAVWVADWANGLPLVATKGTHVVCVNVFVAESGYWTGDIPLLLRNACRWSTGIGEWVSVSPTSGSVGPGDSVQVEVNFTAAGLFGGNYTADLVIASNDCDEDPLIVPLLLNVTGMPDIAVEPDSILAFPAVFIGYPDTLPLTVKNEGTDLLLVTDIETNNHDYTVIDSTAFALSPAGSKTVRVAFGPTSTGPIAGTLAIMSNDPDEPILEIGLLGEGVVPPVISTQPDSLEAHLAFGQVRKQTLNIVNSGGSDLNVSRIKVAVRSSSSLASIATSRAVPHTAVTSASSLESSDPLKRLVNRTSGTLERETGISSNLFDDVCPSVKQNVALEGPQAQWDLLFDYEVESVTGDNRNVGVEFDGTYFYVSAGDGQLGSTHIHKFDRSGNYVTSFPEPGGATGWGLRDLAWDGQYLYGSDDQMVTCFDTQGHLVTEFPGPENPNRALAYDPATDHFWTANWSSPIYEFDRTGAVVHSYYHDLVGIYGMAWDDVSEGGPYLWVFDQGGSPAQTFHQFDPRSGVFTGVQYTVDLGDPAAMAGGAFLTTEWDPGLAVLGGLSQGTPDRIFGLELAPHTTWISVDTTAALIPAGHSFPLGVTFNATGLVEGDYLADIVISSNDPARPQLAVAAHLRVSEQNRIFFEPSRIVAYDSCGFHVNINILTTEEIAGYQMDTNFPPASVQLDNFVHGDFMGSGGGTYFTLGPDIDNEAGIVTFGAYLLGTEGAPTGEGNLASLYFSRVGSSRKDTTVTISGLEVVSPDMSTPEMEVGDLELHLMNTKFGDFNGDGRVTVTDILQVSTRWGSVAGDSVYDPWYDVDLIDPGNFCSSAPDGDIDIVDVQLVASRWSGTSRPRSEQLGIPAVAIVTHGFTSIGEVGTVDLVAQDAVGLGAYEFVLRYNPSMLRLVAAEDGGFLSRTGNSSGFLGPKEEEGSVRFAAYSFGSHPGASGDGSLARVRFEILDCGQCELRVQKALVVSMEGDQAEISGQIPSVRLSTCGTTDVPDGSEKVAYALGQSFPNPFVGSTSIQFALANPGRVLLRIFSVDGRLVRTLVDESRSAGYYVERWDGLTESGKHATSGIYFCSISAGDFKQSKKMILLR